VRLAHRSPLLLVHGSPYRAASAAEPEMSSRRSTGQVTSPPQAVEIHRLVGHGPGNQFRRGLRPRHRCRGSSPCDWRWRRWQNHSESCQRAPQADGVVDRLTRGSLDSRIDFEHGTPLRSVALAVDIPFRILHPTRADLGRMIDDVLARRGGQRRNRVRATVRRVGAMRRVIRTGRSTAASGPCVPTTASSSGHLPMKPPPPIGLVNRSGSSLSSTSPPSRSANSCPR